jgi:A/G-specific adenine glycosylase
MTKKSPHRPVPAAEDEACPSRECWAPVLLAWYDAHRRDLPWRTPSPRDPYKVWVSEIMLQQTKVEAARQYYLRWMERFPDIASLAAADPDDVLRQWQGLGYYSRARNLQAAARDICGRFGGVMPATRAEIRTLKGIGDYTAGAILSMAYGLREPAVDGNVLRVFARLYQIEENILSTPVRKQVTELVLTQLPADRPGDFNEALMDLGATVCIPGTPHCQDCPLADRCRARLAGKEQELPLRIVRKDVPVEAVAALWLQNAAGRLLVHRRPDKGLLAGMTELLSCGVTADPDAGRTMEDAARESSAGVRRKAARLLGTAPIVEDTPCARLRHVFSSRIWDIQVFAARVHGAVQPLPDDTWRWIAPGEAGDILWAGPYGRLSKKLLQK